MSVFISDDRVREAPEDAYAGDFGAFLSIPFADGTLEFALAEDGSVISRGTSAIAERGLVILSRAYNVTPLDLVRSYAPEKRADLVLEADHRRRLARTGREIGTRRELPPVELLESLPLVELNVSNAAVGGAVIVNSDLAGDVDSPDFDPRDQWSLADGVYYLGRGPHDGYGIHKSDRFFVVLGPATQGMVMVCMMDYPQQVFGPDAPIILVEERVGPNLWGELENITSQFSIVRGYSYGYYFHGFAVRRIRLSIRSRTPGDELRWAWAGQF